MSDDRLSQADLDRILADPLRATPVDAERMARELLDLRERVRSLTRRRGRKISDAQVIEIRERRAKGETLRAIGAAYGISHPYVRDICLGKERPYVDSDARKEHKE